jgi:MSHA biogenesis protein MshO
MTRRHCQSEGFTLVEMIMVIVITGVLAGMAAVFITKPVQGYVDSVRRAELTDAADVALRRMARDVRLALPNSLREVVANQSFEFIMTKSGGRYRADGDGSSSTGDFLSFTDTGDLTFDVLGPMPAMEAGDRFVVYNLGEGYSPADAYSGGNVATIGGTGVITANPVALTPSNPFASQSPPLPSPSARFQIVDKDELVVRYVCDGHTLMRMAGCTLVASPACGTGSLLAGALTGEPTATCSIDYTSATTGRIGLLYIQLTLTQSGESVTLFQQIHVDNSP